MLGLKLIHVSKQGYKNYQLFMIKVLSNAVAAYKC